MNSTNSTTHSVESAEAEVEWWRILIIIVLSLLTGLFSGLNLGIIGLDPNYLELLTLGPFETKEDERDAAYAKKIIPLRKRGNLLLCTIILGNVSVGSILSIFMAELTSGLIGVIISTAIIMIFGEILPQSVCSRHALVIGAYTTWILWIFVILLFPIAFPISAILDKILGQEDGEQYNKSKMKRLFEMYEKEKLLDPSERKILSAALELQEKTAESVMTNLEETFMLDIDSILDKDLLRHIYTKGFSRIPIYQGHREKIVGILMARDLILINPDKQRISIRQLSSILVRNVIQIDHATRLDPILTYFKKGQSHLGIITKVEQYEDRDPQIKMIGIITLEDIIKELLQNEKDDGINKKQLTQGYKQTGEKLQHKEKLVLLFSGSQAGKELSSEELLAVCEFLQKQVKAFNTTRLRKKVMIELIKNSQVQEIYSNYDANQQRNFGLKESFCQGKEIKITSKQNKIEDKIKAYTQKNMQNYYNTNVSPRRTFAFDDKPSESNHIRSSDIKLRLTDGTAIKNGSNDNDQLISQDLQQDDSQFLYRRGVASEDFILLLQGKVQVQSGLDQFQVTLSTFNYFGLDALITDNYIPDYTARVSKYARIIRISRINYRKAISDVKNFLK
ncbi:UNKNOWN [Stylonychia lemnae]|uniref:Uncharacterized protein n=1 Tax=Stylonychia lemnae TaxID=5949 RepID=A0A078B4F0_STYLE|nr:UNKNOWN [Stylonychia lemnae]|eukprot:CDW89146.1 UNKNOWN [Stylonychia lemnae]